MTAEVFLDTAFAIAVAVPSDQLHARALALADWLDAEGTRLVTTRAVMLEIGNTLAKRRYRPDAVRLLAAMDTDPKFTVVSVTDELYNKGFDLFRNRMDKEWGLVDCISFIVMKERGLTEALAHDEHFEQAGFKALLRSQDA